MTSITVGLWQKVDVGWAKIREIRTWESIEIEPRHLQPGMWVLRMPFDDQALAVQKTRVITFDFRGERFTGLIEEPTFESDETGRPVLVASGTGALALLGDALCWPDPASPLNAQNTVTYRATGAGETVLRNVIEANLVTRIGYDIDLPASQGRGTAGFALQVEFDNLLETVVKHAEANGLGVRMGLVDTTSSTRAVMTCEFFEPVDRSGRVRLSHKVGTLRSWRQSDKVPTGTRAIVAAAKAETTLDITSVNFSLNRLSIGGETGSEILEGVDSEIVEGEAIIVRHHLKTGSIIRFSGKGTPPAPLEDNKAYFAIRIDADTFKVASTRSRALTGNAIDLTTNGVAPLKVTETTRIFHHVIRTAPETEWGRKRELFQSTSIDNVGVNSYEKKANEALDEAVEQGSFELEATEAEGMRYVTHYAVGDLVTVELLTGVTKVDRLSAVKLTASASDGVTVSLVVGNPDAGNPLFGQAAIVRGLRTRVRNLEQET